MLRVRTVTSGTQGSPYLSTHYFNGTTQADANSANSRVNAFWTALNGVRNTSVHWDIQDNVDVINPATGVITGSFAVTGGEGFGAEADQLAPLASQGLIRLTTGVFNVGRQIRGRLFIPGLTKNDVTDGRLATATIAALNTAAQGLRDAADADWVVWSRVSGLTPSVTGVAAWDQWAILRSRRD
jgi:hypothetical protein